MFILMRKIHRMTALVITTFSIIMGTTGFILKYKIVPVKYIVLSRSIHNVFSPFFLIALLVMITTGLCMYFYPWIIKLKSKNR